MNLAEKLASSFEIKPGGFSSRKLTAFVGVGTSLFITIRFTNNGNLVAILTIWLVFVGVLMGIVTIDQVIRLREGRTTEVKVTQEKSVSVSETKTPLENIE